ncbi:unnamed protein product [Absidia cylindrospora]
MSSSTEKEQQQQQQPVKESFNPLAIAKYLGPSTPKLDHLLRFLNSVRVHSILVEDCGVLLATTPAIARTDQAHPKLCRPCQRFPGIIAVLRSSPYGPIHGLH